MSFPNVNDYYDGPLGFEHLQLKDIDSVRGALQITGGHEIGVRAVTWAHFMSSRLEEDPLGPSRFVENAVLAVYDLRRGEDGRAFKEEEKIDSPLVKLKDREYWRLFFVTPNIARIAFGQEFGQAVETIMTIRGAYFPEAPYFEPEKDEVIESEIDTVEAAYEKIVLDACRRSMEDTEDIELTMDQAAEAKKIALTSLAKGPFDLPLSISENNDDIETMKDLQETLQVFAPLLAELTGFQVLEIPDGLLLELRNSPIDPQLATFTRDFIFIRIYESIVGSSKLEKRFIYPSIDDEVDFRTRSLCRMINYMRDHPEVIKEPVFRGGSISEIL